ncbi:MAG: IS1634 family transposase [Coriobacteriales bacterium]
MHIEKFTVCGRAYLRLVKSRRRLTRNGKPISGKELVLGLGPLSKHDDGKPDYLGRLRASFRAGKPLIRELEPFVGEAPKARILVPFEPGDARCLGEPRRMAATILDPVFSALGLDEFFTSVKFSSKIQYDLTGIVRLLVYGRLLDPASKSATMEQNGRYYRPLVSSTNDDNVYDALDVIQKNAQKIIRRMNARVTRGTGRSSKVVFYDVTNFFFETPHPDHDVLDDAGNCLEKGLRKMGVSKENRKQPVVQLGLFLDDDGIPISFGMFPGNTLDHHTLRPAMKETVDALGLKRFVLVADRGMHSGTNMCHVTDAGNGYIVSKSLRKSAKEEIDWAISAEGYDFSDETFRCKSRVVTRTVRLAEKDEDGNEKTVLRKFREKVVVYWSRAFCERERHENASFLSFVEKLKANPGGFRITAAQSQSLRRFLGKDVLDRKTGNVLDGTRLAAMIDDEKLSAFNALFGYYQIVTSELEMPDREIIDRYHGLTQIEDQFREMKSTLETRPIYVRTREHVEAHLMICFIALTMMRLIQRKTRQSLGPDFGKGLNWTYGLPGARLSNALREWQVTELPGDYYQMLNASNDDIMTLFKAFGINISAKIYTKGDIRRLKSTVNPF